MSEENNNAWSQATRLGIALLMCYIQVKTGATTLAAGLTVNANAVRAHSFAQSSQSVTNSIRLCPLLHRLRNDAREQAQSVVLSRNRAAHQRRTGKLHYGGQRYSNGYYPGAARQDENFLDYGRRNNPHRCSCRLAWDAGGFRDVAGKPRFVIAQRYPSHQIHHFGAVN